MDRTVLITGAAGNMGAKLRHHLQGRMPLRLIDRDPRGDETIVPADLAHWDLALVRLFDGVHTVFHLAADPTAQQTWPNVIAPNIDAVVHVFQAAVRSGSVRRVVYASSNHVMGGYKDDSDTLWLTTDLPPRPGARYLVNGEQRDSTAYAAAKLFGERLAKCYTDEYGLSVLAVRFGWVRGGDNRPEDVPAERGAWFRLMWLSNRDYCHLMDCCLDADPGLRFAILHGMSANTGMRWDLTTTERLVGYRPQDDVMRGSATPLSSSPRGGGS
jgi:nucleoside-diphosphate-sugar epimerase